MNPLSAAENENRGAQLLADSTRRFQEGETRLNELVARQNGYVRDAVATILALPNVRLDRIYIDAVRNPEVFILFLIRQLQHHGAHDVEPVDIVVPDYTCGRRTGVYD